MKNMAKKIKKSKEQIEYVYDDTGYDHLLYNTYTPTYDFELIYTFIPDYAYED
jgi:hypothetical protein